MKEERKKLQRFTEEQVILGKVLQSLIGFYYSIDSYDLDDEALSNSNRKNTNKFLKSLYRRNILTGRAKYIILRKYSLTNMALKQFIGIMEQLIDEIKKSNYVHILLTCVKDLVSSDIKTQEELNIKYSDSMDDSESEEIFFGPYPNEMKASTTLVNRAVIDAIGNIESVGHAENDKYRVKAEHERFYFVKPTTNFGRRLLSMESDSDDEDKEIPHFMSMNILNIDELLINIIIYFHLAFDGFERIKVCRFCGKLFFEKKKGSKIYCSDTCRVSYSRLAEPRERRLCRERQKAWGRNYLMRSRYSLDPVSKYDCASCNKFVKSGECEILLRKNEKAIKEKRKKKENEKKEKEASRKSKKS